MKTVRHVIKHIHLYLYGKIIGFSYVCVCDYVNEITLKMNESFEIT